jgi:hypothetical protein
VRGWMIRSFHPSSREREKERETSNLHVMCSTVSL